jgi:hypothetical protein
MGARAVIIQGRILPPETRSTATFGAMFNDKAPRPQQIVGAKSSGSASASPLPAIRKSTTADRLLLGDVAGSSNGVM